MKTLKDLERHGDVRATGNFAPRSGRPLLEHSGIGYSDGECYQKQFGHVRPDELRASAIEDAKELRKEREIILRSASEDDFKSGIIACSIKAKTEYVMEKFNISEEDLE